MLWTELSILSHLRVLSPCTVDQMRKFPRNDSLNSHLRNLSVRVFRRENSHEMTVFSRSSRFATVQGSAHNMFKVIRNNCVCIRNTLFGFFVICMCFRTCCRNSVELPIIFYSVEKPNVLSCVVGGMWGQVSDYKYPRSNLNSRA